MPLNSTCFEALPKAAGPVTATHNVICAIPLDLPLSRHVRHALRNEPVPEPGSPEMAQQQENDGNMDEAWNQAASKAEKDGKLCSEAIEKQLKEAAAHAIATILSGGMQKSTDPAIVRALVREVMQEIQFLRGQPHKSAAHLNGKLEFVQKNALKRRDQLVGYHNRKAEQVEETKRHAGLGMVLGLHENSSVMQDNDAWLSQIRDPEHAFHTHHTH
jgi:hypothetical protein